MFREELVFDKAVISRIMFRLALAVVKVEIFLLLLFLATALAGVPE